MSKDLRPFTVCFTGHREIRQRDIPARLDTQLAELIKQGYKYFGADGALGFDYHLDLTDNPAPYERKMKTR